MSHPLTAPLLALLTQPGAPFCQAPDAWQPAIEWTLESGQWVCIASQGRIDGWAGWWRVDDDTLEILHDNSFEHYVRLGIPLPLTEGRHCYVPAACVAPWAPRPTVRRLLRLVQAANEDAQMLSWQRQTEGAPRWVSTLAGGKRAT